MTLPDRSAPRKVTRAGLYWPLGLLAVFVLAWSAAWLWLANKVEARMDAARERGGIRLAWRERTISGFPFRIDIAMDDARVSAPSGWALTFPRLEAEAFVFAPGHWVAVAPRGLTLDRPSGGPITVEARVLRASLGEIGSDPPRVSVEGLGLTFATAARGKPFAISAAQEFHLHTIAGAGNQGLVALELDDAQAQLPPTLTRIIDGRRITVAADLAYSQAASLAGPSWPAAVAAWRAAGGEISVRDLRVDDNGTRLEVRGGTLGVDGEGRLQGALTGGLSLTPPSPPAQRARAPGAPQAPAARLTIDFSGGQMRIERTLIAPAPRLF